MSDTVLYEIKNHIATITLNRPERHNAINFETYRALNVAFLAANEDSTVRCIVFTGRGRSFCSGDDVVEIMASSGALSSTLNTQDNQPASTTPAVVTAMRASRCPIINAVNGAAVGFGMELSLLCDIRIASDSARFSEMFIRRGIIATSISFDLLPGIVGPALAAEMLLTGEIINAHQALQAGLVSRVVQADELMATALDLAAKIAANAPLAVERAKTGLNLKRDQKTDQMEQHLAESLRFLSGTKDHKESVAAFLEKRKPQWMGE